MVCGKLGGVQSQNKRTSEIRYHHSKRFTRNKITVAPRRAGRPHQSGNRLRFSGRSRQACDPWEPVKPGIKGQDALDSMMFHDGEMHGVARRKLAVPKDNLLGTLGNAPINRQHLIDNSEERIKRWLDCVAAVDCNVAM